jgi:HK97 family phage major capsid protein
MKLTKDRIAEIAKEVADSVLSDGKRHALAPQAATYDDMVKAMGKLTAPTPTPPEKGIFAGQFMRALAACKGDPERASRWAEKAFGEEHPVTKTLQASDAAAGGVLVPTEFSTDIIELLREMAVVRSMGPRIIPMPTGSLQIPKITGGATATYLGETDNITADEQAFGTINLTWKKLAVIVPISNDLLRFEAVGADAIIRDDSLYAMISREDQAFLRGDGTENTPKGILNWVLAANTFAANATINLANVTADLADAILRLRQANVKFINPGWIMAPRSEMYLRSVRDANGNFAFKDEMDRGTVFGWKYASTNEVPITLGGGSDESELYLVDFADMIVGESNRVSVDTSAEAAYWDGSALQSAYSRDLTLLRLIAHHDFGVRHEESIVVVTAVKWTP